MLHRGGPQLPYQVIAGVVPCRSGWLVASSKIAGVTMSMEEPAYFPSFVEILWTTNRRSPSLEVHAPIGYLDETTPDGRACDREARAPPWSSPRCLNPFSALARCFEERLPPVLTRSPGSSFSSLPRDR